MDRVRIGPTILTMRLVFHASTGKLRKLPALEQHGPFGFKRFTWKSSSGVWFMEDDL